MTTLMCSDRLGNASSTLALPQLEAERERFPFDTLKRQKEVEKVRAQLVS
jgi:hypothetical protein